MVTKHYSAYFGKQHKEFVEKGVFDGYINRDAKLHVDPLLLKKSKTPEFRDTYQKLLDYFRVFVKLVPRVVARDLKDRYYRAIYERMHFPEFYFIGLGYSGTSKAGKGIGGKKSAQLANTAIDIIMDGVDDPEIFLLLNLFEKNIGADGISDIIIHVIRQELLLYTIRIAKELDIHTKEFNSYQLPYYINRANGKCEPIIFVPTEIIRDLPQAYDRSQVQLISDYNNAIRVRISKEIGIAWKDMQDKELVKRSLLKHPQVMKNMASFYRNLEGQAYNFNRDDNFIYVDAIVHDIIKESPLTLSLADESADSVLKVAHLICRQFKKLIEDNRMYNLLYDDNGKFKDEKSVQELFFIMADGYCFYNNIDLNRESDTGIGHLDFKFSHGYQYKVILEMKLARNSQLIHGLELQLPAYLKAEGTSKGIYMIIISSDNDEERCKKLMNMIELSADSKRLKDSIIIVDARKRPSASNLS